MNCRSLLASLPDAALITRPIKRRALKFYRPVNALARLFRFVISSVARVIVNLRASSRREFTRSNARGAAMPSRKCALLFLNRPLFDSDRCDARKRAVTNPADDVLSAVFSATSEAAIGFSRPSFREPSSALHRMLARETIYLYRGEENCRVSKIGD